MIAPFCAFCEGTRRNPCQPVFSCVQVVEIHLKEPFENEVTEMYSIIQETLEQPSLEKAGIQETSGMSGIKITSGSIPSFLQASRCMLALSAPNSFSLEAKLWPLEAPDLKLPSLAPWKIKFLFCYSNVENFRGSLIGPTQDQSRCLEDDYRGVVIPICAGTGRDLESNSDLTRGAAQTKITIQSPSIHWQWKSSGTGPLSSLFSNGESLLQSAFQLAKYYFKV